MPNSAVVLTPPYDFAPAGQKEDTSTTLDTFIASLSPWGYWKLNESSGAPQDSSGNARHGSVSVAPSYSQSAITSKVGNSMRFDGGRLTFPAPFTRLGALSNTWAIGGLFYIEAELGTSSPAQSVQGSPIFGQNGTSFASNSDFFVSIALQTGSVILCRSGGQVGGGDRNVGQLNQAMSIFAVGTDIPGVWYMIHVFVNGVLFATTQRGNAGAGTATQFQVGRCTDAAAPFPKFRASNICCWNVGLTTRNIIDITELMLDQAAYSTAWKP